MSKLSFQDVNKLLKDNQGNMSVLLERMDDILDFVEDVDSVGADIFRDKSDEYTLDMLALVKSLAASLLIIEGQNPYQVFMLVQDTLISNYCALIMKLSIGLAAMEELR